MPSIPKTYWAGSFVDGNALCGSELLCACLEAHGVETLATKRRTHCFL